MPRSSPARLTTGAYRPLTDHLRASQENRLDFTFTEIETILGRSLPQSAYTYASWWANAWVATRARAWLEAGFLARAASTQLRRVTFERQEREDLGR